MSSSSFKNANIKTNTKTNIKKCKCEFKSKKHKKTIILYECLCGKKFCLLHRLPHQHDCNYDHTTHEKNILKNNNPEVSHTKVEKL